MICNHCGKRILSKPVTTEEIIPITERYFKKTLSQLVKKDRQRVIVYPRQVLMYFLRENTRMGFKEIGKMFNRDHTTVIHSIGQINNLLCVDDKVRYDILKITNLLRYHKRKIKHAA